MTGALPPGDRCPGPHGEGAQHPARPVDVGDLWPPDLDWAGDSLVTLDRIRDPAVLRPTDELLADEVIEELLARIDGRRTPSRG